MSPSTSSADLGRLVARVWHPTRDVDGPVVVSHDRPVGRHVVESYAVVPNVRHPRFLVPVSAPQAVHAAFGPFHTTDSSSARRLGHVLALGSRIPGSEHLLRRRLYVSVRPDDDARREMLVPTLARALGREPDEVVAVLPVRRVTPNAKPTLRLFSRAGDALGYAKVGWSPATCAVVDNEVRAVREVAPQLRTLEAPQLLAEGTLDGQRYAVVAPLPPHVGAWRVDPAEATGHLLDIAATGQVGESTVAASTWAERVRTRIRAVTHAAPDETTVLLGLLDALARHDEVVRFGRWHGDWVPWNVGQVGGRLVVWDWEYSDPDVPVGLDLLHWHFQQALPRTGTLPGAQQALDAATPTLAALGVPATQWSLVSAAYLLEMFLRATELAAAGSGWNPRIHPAMLDMTREVTARL